MCRCIVRLREGSEVLGRPDMEAAALQYVRKVSGFRQPSQANEGTFAAAVADIADATEKLMTALVVRV